MYLLPVQPSCLPGSSLRLVEVIGSIQGEDLGTCLPRAKHHLQCQCCTGHQPLQATVTGCSWLAKESHITDHRPDSSCCQAPTLWSHHFQTNNRRSWLQSTSLCQPFPSHVTHELRADGDLTLAHPETIPSSPVSKTLENTNLPKTLV